jgi:hypothetical protein
MPVFAMMVFLSICIEDGWNRHAPGSFAYVNALLLLIDLVGDALDKGVIDTW